MAGGEPLLEFLEVMRRLRAECDWKREQTHRSLARYLLEETHETLEAIDTGDVDHLREELGDLLLQVYFHAVIAEEAGAFTIDDVASGITEKMVRRNPHVFGDPDQTGNAGPQDAAAVNDAWEAIKARERTGRPLTEGLPNALPALLYAAKVLERRDRAGLESPEVSRLAALAPQPPETLGDRLLALVAEANEHGIDPEQALRDAVRRLPEH